MNFSFKKSTIGGALLLLLALQSTVVKADDDKSKSKPKKETKYDRLFKDKKVETARSKFITVYKLDNKIYFELPRTLLKKQMLLGGENNLNNRSNNGHCRVYKLQSSTVLL